MWWPPEHLPRCFWQSLLPQSCPIMAPSSTMECNSFIFCKSLDGYSVLDTLFSPPQGGNEPSPTIPLVFFPCPMIPPRWPAVPTYQFSSKPMGQAVSFPSNSSKALAMSSDDSTVPVSACSACSWAFSAGW